MSGYFVNKRVLRVLLVSVVRECPIFTSFPDGSRAVELSAWHDRDRGRDQGARRLHRKKHSNLIARVNKTLILECSPFVISQNDGS